MQTKQSLGGCFYYAKKYIKITLDNFVATYYNKNVATKRGDTVAALKKGTKLTDSPKDFMLRVRLDKIALERLDLICKQQGINRSEAVRQGIEEQYNKLKK